MIYNAFGLTIHSDISLPLPTGALDFGMGTLKIVYQSISFETKQLGADRIYTRLSGGQILCTISEVASFLITPPNLIIVDPDSKGSKEAVQLFLLGSALGVILHALPLVVIHGCAIKIGSGCVVFAGPRGVGKSTLALAFAKQGFNILADDISVVGFNNKASPLVWPAYPQTKLWDSSLSMLDIRSNELEPIYERSSKFCLPIQQHFYSSPLQIDGVCFLSVEREVKDNTVRIERVLGAEGYRLLHVNTYRVEHLSKIGNTKEHFRLCTELLRMVPIFKLIRPMHSVQPGELVCKILEIFQPNRVVNL